jgi:hypothetical protein
MLIFLFGDSVSAAGSRSVQLRWEDLEGVIGGKNVSVESKTGAVYKGRVRTVASDSILLEGRNPSVKRDDAKEIRFTEYVVGGSADGWVARSASQSAWFRPRQSGFPRVRPIARETK